MNGNLFFIKKSKKACLLIHGLTSSTQEVEELTNFLYKKNFTIIAPLLKGHNTKIQDLNKTKWQDWYWSVIEAHDKIKDYKKIFVIGISIGATLALHLAKNKKISGLVLLAPAIFYNDWKIRFLPIIKNFIKIKKKNYRKYYPWRKVSYYDIYSEELIKNRIAYKKVGLSALSSALSLIKVVKKEINKINCPTLLIHSKKDHTILPSSSSYIYDNLKVNDKRVVWLENSGHVISVDNEKKKVFQLTHNFIKNK